MGGEGRIIDAARPDMSPPNQGPTLARLKAELEALSRQLQEHQSQRLPIKALPLANRREKAILEEFQQLRGHCGVRWPRCNTNWLNTANRLDSFSSSCSHIYGSALTFVRGERQKEGLTASLPLGSDQSHCNKSSYEETVARGQML